MKTVMLTVFLVLVSALSSAAQAPASAQAQDGRDYEALGRSVVLDLAAGRFDKVEAQFDATMAAALPLDALAQTWKGLLGQVGAFKEAGEVRVSKVQGFQVASVTCVFEQKTLDAKIVFSSKSISGLHFAPHQPWTAPGYANASAFEEKPLTLVNGTWELPGTLTMPRKDGPFPTRNKEGLVPGVVLVQGSGPEDEDETIGPNKPFKDLAWGLGSNGVAVLRYVKRTQKYGAKSSADPNALTVNDETVDDARAAAALLAKQPGIDPKRVYVVGHSLGGMMGPRIASGDAAIAGLILIAGTTRPLEVVILDQLRYIATLQQDPKDKEEIQKQITAAEESAREIESLDLKPGTTVNLLGAKIPASYFLDLRNYRPAEVAAKLTIPILILQGGRDYQVTSPDFEGWQKALAGHANVTLKMYPAMNHLFIAGTSAASPDDYQKAGHVSEEVIRDMAAWIATGKVAAARAVQADAK
jgi:dienelactone hydrolase